MNKYFILGIILIALLVLTGCDALLEGFFPEFADTFGGDDMVTLDISVDVANLNANPSLRDLTVMVIVEDMDESGKGQKFYFKVKEGFFWTTMVVPRHYFAVYTFLMRDGDDVIDGGEESNNAVFWDDVNQKDLGHDGDLSKDGIGNYIITSMTLKQGVNDVDLLGPLPIFN